MSWYLLELRRSPLRWWFPFFVGLDLAAVFGRSHWWIGVWPQASAAAQIPSVYFAPVLATAAAWAAGRVHRGRFTEQLRVSAVPTWRVDAAQLSIALTLGLGAYTIGALAAGIASLSQAGPGFLWPGYVFLGASVIVASTGVGHLAGRLFRSPLATPLICGLGLFVGLASFGHQAGLFVLSGDPQDRVALGPLLARWSVALALVAAATFVPSALGQGNAYGRLTPSRSLPAVASILTVILGCAAVTTGSLVVARTPVADPVCTSTTPSVCLWPEDRKYLSAATAMINRLNAIPAGLLSYPAEFYERGLRDSRAYPSDFVIAEGNSWSISSGLVGPIEEATYPTYCPAQDDDSESRRLAAEFDIGQWIESRLNGEGQPSDVHGGRPNVDLDAIAVLITQPEDIQAVWVRERLTIIEETVCA